MWHNKNKNESAYNYWNFTEAHPWDNYTNPDAMWYHPNSQMLASTVRYKIGIDSIEKINVALQPRKYIHENKLAKTKIFGLAISWKHEVEREIIYLQSDDYDVDYLCPKATKFNTTDIVFNLGMQFTENQYVHKYYSFSDLLSQIGGLLSSITLLTGQLTAFYVLVFLIKVMSKLKESILETYQVKQISFLILTNQMIKDLLTEMKEDKISLSKEHSKKLNKIVIDIEDNFHTVSKDEEG